MALYAAGKSASNRLFISKSNPNFQTPFKNFLEIVKHHQYRTMSDTSPAKEAGTNDSSQDFPVTLSITSKLSSSFEPTYLDVINESHMHNVPNNSETHFKVVVVSEKFDGVASLVKRHRMINSILSEELEGPVHALSIVAKSPSQWEKLAKQHNGEENIKISPSPNCRGGDGSLPKRI